MSQEQEPKEGEKDSPVVNENPQISQADMEIASYVELNPNAINDPEIKEVMDRIQGMQSQESEDKTLIENDDEKAETTEEKKVEAKTNEEVVESIFNQKSKSLGLSFNEEVAEAIKKKYSIEDSDKFFNSVDTWRKDSQERADIEKQLNQVTDSIAGLPEGIVNMIEAYTSGNDWTSVAKDSFGGLDYTKSFESHNKEEMVKHYLGDFYNGLKEKLSNGDIDDTDFQESIINVHQAAKASYDNDKKSRTDAKLKIQSEQQEQLERLSNSAKTTTEHFRNENPIFGKKEYRSKIDKISSDLDKGDVSKYFMEKDGSWRKDAAERLFFAVYGKDEGQKAIENAMKDAKSEGVKEVVDRGNKKPNVKSSQRQGTTEADLAKKISDGTMIGSTTGMQSNNPFSHKPRK